MKSKHAIFGHWSRDFWILLAPGIVFLILALSLNLNAYASVLALLIFVGLDSGHAMYTFARMSFIKGEWTESKRYLFAPILFFVVIATWVLMKWPYLFSFVIYYTGYHYMRQHWGVLRWYERLQSYSKIGSRTRKIFLYVAFILPVLTFHFMEPGIAGIYSDRDFILFPNDKLYLVFRWISLAWILVWGIYEFRQLDKKNNSWNAPLIYVGQLAVHAIGFTFGKNVWTIFGPSIFIHSISYFALSHRVFEANVKGSKKSVYWAVGIVVAILLLAFPIKLLEDELMDIDHLDLIQSLILAATITPGLIHFHFDAFLWRRDHPSFAKVISMFAIVVFSFFSLPQVLTAQTVISKSVGQVGEHVVTSREVQINSAIENILYNSKSSVVALDLKGKEFEKALNSVLLERMVFAEAVTFRVQEIPNTEMQAALKKVEPVLDKANSLKALSPGNSEIREAIRRKITAKKFIQFKAQSSVVPVSDNEVRDYFQNNKSRFGNSDFNQFKESIRAFLSRQQVDERLKSWFEILQSKYRVRNFQTE